MSCQGCGTELTKRHQKAFCSNACQRNADRRANVERWLRTGQAVYVKGGRHYVYLYLLEQQAGDCAICGMAARWNDAPLTLVLDHVDGDSSNNSRPNLRLVCPNCDSQLPTFKARNRGAGRAWRRQRYAEGRSY